MDDPILSWNQGNFKLVIDKNGKGQITITSQKTEDKIDIQTMDNHVTGI